MSSMVPPDDEIPDLLPSAAASSAASGAQARTSPHGEASAKASKDPDAPPESGALAPLELELNSDAPSSSDFGLVPASDKLNSPHSPESGEGSHSAQTSSPGWPGVPESTAPRVPDYSTMGGDISLGDDLDDLEFGNASSQLNMSVETIEPDREVPWPTGRTPFDDEISADHDQAQRLSGFGAVPSGLLQCPLYFWRVLLAQKELTAGILAARDRLQEAEERRDQVLARLALSHREALQKQERFAALYSGVKSLEQEIQERKIVVKSEGAEGALALADISSRLDTLKAARVLKDNDRGERRLALDAADKEVARQTAVLKRIDIQHRNLQGRADKQGPGEALPTKLEAQFVVLEGERDSESERLDAKKEKQKSLKALLKKADQELGAALSAEQTEEGRLEALRITQETKNAAQNKSLDKASLHHQTELADAARIIVELRGEINVEPALREELLTLDETVMAAFVHHQSMILAKTSMDPESYRKGRSVWIAILLALACLLAYSAR